MIKGSLRLGGDLIEVVIRENELLFFDVSSGVMSPIEGVQIKKSGVVKQFPDLENDGEWKKKAIERLKEHMKTFPTEEKKLNYVGEELEKSGYEKLIIQRAGFRTKKWR